MTSDNQTPPNIWKFRDGESFLGHTVSMRLEQQLPGRVPQVRHIVSCDICPDELELYGYYDDDIKAAYQQAIITHHLKRLAILAMTSC